MTLREVEPDAARAWMLRSLGLASVDAEFDPPISPASRRCYGLEDRPVHGDGERTGPMFVGRERERARIDRLLEDARAGAAARCCCTARPASARRRSCGGRSAARPGMRVLRARGIETESDIPFAGLAELVTPLVDRLDAIPEVQAARCAARWRSAPRRRTTASRCRPGCSACWRPPPRSGRCSWRSTTPSGSTRRRWRRSCSPGRRVGAEGIAMLGRCATGPRWRIEVPWLERLRVGAAGRRRGARAARRRAAGAVGRRPAGEHRGRQPAGAARDPAPADGQRAGREPLEEPLRPGTGVERAFRRALDALDDVRGAPCWWRRPRTPAGSTRSRRRSSRPS